MRKVTRSPGRSSPSAGGGARLTWKIEMSTTRVGTVLVVAEASVSTSPMTLISSSRMVAELLALLPKESPSLISGCTVTAGEA
jgi:hypothetical protein